MAQAMQHSCSICHHSRCLKLEKLVDVSHVCRAATVAPSAAYRPGHEQQNTHTAHRLQIWNNVSYLASYLPGGWHFPDEFLRPFLLSLAVGWLVHHRPGAPDSPQGGKPWGRRRWFLRLLRGRGTALGVMKALSRSLPLRRDAGAGQRLESGSLGRHAFAFSCPTARLQTFAQCTIVNELLWNFPRRLVCMFVSEHGCWLVLLGASLAAGGQEGWGNLCSKP